MFRNLIRPGSHLMVTMTWITDCIFFSLFWLLGCFPLFTLGGASAALYDATFRTFRQGEPHGWSRFWQVFKTNWKSGIVPGMIYLAVFFAGAWGMIQIWNAAVYGQISWMFFSAAAIVALVLLGMLNVMLPMLSRFENSLSGLLRNTVLLSMANLPLTLAVGFFNAIALILCFRFLFPIFFLPSLTGLISSLCLEPMFRPYMKEATDAAE